MKSDLSFVAAIVFYFALLAPQLSAASGTVTYLGSLQIKNETFYQPIPVEPGSYFDFFVVVRNTGKNPLSVVCSLDPKYPFSVDLSENNSRVFTNIAESREFLLKFRVKVDDNALEGDNHLDFTCTDSDSKTTNTATFDIFVQARASTVNIESATVSPPLFRPGQKGILVVRVKSESPNYLRDFKIRLDISSDALPFAVVNSTNERMVSQVEPQKELEFPFELMAYPSASAGVYKLPIVITYSDKLGKAYSISQSTGLVVGSSPVIEVSAESPDLIQSGMTGKVIVRVMNRGLSNVKLLKVALLQSKDYVVLSSPTQYIGSVNSDDFETAEFRVFTSPNSTRPVQFLLDLTYTDSSNNPYDQKAVAAIQLFDKSEALKYGLERNPDNTLVYVIGVLVAIYLFFKYAFPAARRAVEYLLSRRDRQQKGR